MSLNPYALTDTELRLLRKGHVITVGRHRYGMCQDCRRIIKLTGFGGGLHLCE